MADVRQWEQEKVTVTLTNKQWSALTCFLLMSTNYRKGELEAWQDLAERKEEDGAPTFPNAESNAEFWRQQIETIEEIQKAIDARNY